MLIGPQPLNALLGELCNWSGEDSEEINKPSIPRNRADKLSHFFYISWCGNLVLPCITNGRTATTAMGVAKTLTLIVTEIMTIELEIIIIIITTVIQTIFDRTTITIVAEQFQTIAMVFSEIIE